MDIRTILSRAVCSI